MGQTLFSAPSPKWLLGQVAKGDMSKWLGKMTTGLLKQLFGDASFPSFVKMLTMKNRQVILG